MKLDKLLLLSFVTALAACGSDLDSKETPSNTNVSAGSNAPTSDASVTSFSNAPINPYFPISPGLTYVYAAVEDEDSDVEEVEDISIHISFTADIKVINEVNTSAMVEYEYEDGELLEKTTSWIAIDSEGAVWILAEDSVEYLDGAVVEEESWADAEEGAIRAQLMIAKPKLGDTFTTEHTDEDDIEVAEVMSITETVSLDDNDEPTFIDVLHYIEIDSDGEEEAEYFHAPGVGLVKFIDDDVTMILTEMDSNTGIEEDLEEETLPDVTNLDDYLLFESLVIHYDDFEEEIIMTFKADTVIEELLVWNPDGKLILELEVNKIGDAGLSELTFTFSDIDDEFEAGLYTVLADTLDSETLLGQVNLTED